MVKRQTTIDDLAGMVQRGFQGVEKNMDEIKNRLDRIEKIFLVDHKHRIERRWYRKSGKKPLEFEVNNLKDLFALK